MKTDVIIIGAGPIGLFSIFQAGMLGMKCHVIDSLEHVGGQCTALYPEKPIYDIPGHPNILAKDLIKMLEEQASPFKPILHLGQSVITLEQKDSNFVITTSKGTIINAKVVVIAAGAGCFGPSKPPIKEIDEFEGKSVFYFVHNKEDFINKEILIAGGGDSAVDWAIQLSSIAKKLYLVHRRDKFRALPESVKKLRELAAEKKIELLIGYQLDSLIGEDGILNSIVLKDLTNNKKTISCEILLPFFGLIQNLGPIINWGVDIHQHHIKTTPPFYETNIPGVYSIGDIITYPGKLKLILTGFSEAASCLHHAYNKVFEGKALHFEYSTTKGVPSNE